MKENKPCWETGLNPIIMARYESYDRMRAIEEFKHPEEDAENKLL